MDMTVNIKEDVFFAHLQPAATTDDATDWNANDIAWNAMDWPLNDGETQ